MSRFFKIIDRVFTKAEKIGFKSANVFHKMTINVILVGMGYCVVTTMRDYNEIFKEQRVF